MSGDIYDNGDPNPEQLDINTIEARANAATPAPWEVMYNVHGVDDRCHGLKASGHRSLLNFTFDPSDMEFIACARDDVPALVAEVRRLQADLSAAVGRADRLSAELERVTVERDMLADLASEGSSQCDAWEKRVVVAEKARDEAHELVRKYQLGKCDGCESRQKEIDEWESRWRAADAAAVKCAAELTDMTTERNALLGGPVKMGPLAAMVTSLKARAEAAEKHLAEIHKLLGRGDHGAKENAACAISAILDLKEMVSAHERDLALFTKVDEVAEKIGSINDDALAKSQERCAELEAQAGAKAPDMAQWAAMREALTFYAECGYDDPMFDEGGSCAKRALTNEAGRAFLARLTKAEAERDGALVLCEEWRDGKGYYDAAMKMMGDLRKAEARVAVLERFVEVAEYFRYRANFKLEDERVFVQAINATKVAP